MQRFTRLRVSGYKSFVDVELPLRPLAVMIGPNGCGKMSLLELIWLFNQTMQEDLTKAIEQQGGINSIVSRLSPEPSQMEFELAYYTEDFQGEEDMVYRIHLSANLRDRLIRLEQLERRFNPTASTPYRYIDAQNDRVRYAEPGETGFVTPTWDYHNNELALAQIPRMYKDPERLRSALAQARFCSFLDVQPRSVVRLPQSLTPTLRPGPNGENLFSALYNLRASHEGLYRSLENVLRIGFPGFRRLEFPVVGSGQVTLGWFQEGLEGPLYPNELSEGTLRFLWLSTVLLSPSAAPITCIDEPEVSLHPELLKLLAGLLQDASMRGQYIVATHSAELIRWLNPEEVLVMEKEEGKSSFTWADSLDLHEWLKEYTLDQLWLMGTLGGRP
ncbi:MAG: AAA family ATPase [Caldilineaceae bacterium]|nr:AAA family ATPase [Caldilineaceae bacterium]